MAGIVMKGFTARGCQQQNASLPMAAGSADIAKAATGSSKNMTPKRENTAIEWRYVKVMGLCIGLQKGNRRRSCVSVLASASATASMGADISIPTTEPLRRPDVRETRR
jgi:hypothetical protein